MTWAILPEIAQVHFISHLSDMSNMKRFLLILLVCGFLLSVSACSSDKDRGQFRNKDRQRSEDKEK
jgi:hypothetical protein